MADFLASQLDFILFFYGLAFVMFGLVCLAVGRMRQIGGWRALAAFGVIHGLGEWLDLTALVTGDTPVFAAFRVAMMATSYVCLLEYGRREGISFRLKLPGPWVHLLFLVPTAMAWALAGTGMAGIVARYSLALPAAFAASLSFLWYARGFSGIKRWISASAGLILAAYGLAAGLVVPPALFWPAAVLNAASFSAATGLPIQLVRGLLAAGLAVCLWTIWGRMAGRESGSERYAAFLRRLYAWVLVSLSITLIGGWVITQVLGNLYRADIEDEADGDIAVLASRLAGESTVIQALAGTLAAQPAIVAAAKGDPSAFEAARVSLGVSTNEAQARTGFLIDWDGRLRIGIGAGAEAIQRDVAEFRNSLAFGDVRAGGRGFLLTYEAAADMPAIFVAAPVRDGGGNLVGAVVLQRSLKRLEADLHEFDRTYFLVDPEGIVVLSNRNEFKFRPLWPLDSAAQGRMRAIYPDLGDTPVFDRQIQDLAWTLFQGERSLVRRAFAEHGRWSLVMALSPSGRFASRVLGIVITLLASLVVLTYLLGRERHMHDSIEMERRLELQLIAQDLRSKAHTDALTGLFNRLRFDHALAEEIARTERYHTPLSLAIFDIDHFKRVNDIHGHQAGDTVLTHLARIAAGATRSTDVLARWGGEEFVLLTPGCDQDAAERVAEKLRARIAAAEFEAVGHITASFGVAQFEIGDSAQSLVARADEALYSAKAAGRNRVAVATLPRAAE